MIERFVCELVTWGQVSRLANRLAEKIRASGFRPDRVVAIARGGYVPARLLCDALDLYDLASIRIAHYEGGANKIPEVRLCSPLPVDARGLNVLLVDDCSDTGDTLALALEHLRGFAPRDIRVAVLHHKQVSSFLPRYYGQRIDAWRWLVYPWAVVEDLSGFLAAMSPCPDSWEEAASQLERRHGIKPPRQTLEKVLAAMRERQNRLGDPGRLPGDRE